MDTRTYQMGVPPVNSILVTGMWLAHSDCSARESAFLGKDLVAGDTFLINPTRTQAAYLAGTNCTSIYCAGQRAQFREEILAGKMPLVPTGNGNGGDGEDKHASFEAHLAALIEPETLAVLASVVGADRWLEAAEMAGL